MTTGKIVLVADDSEDDFLLLRTAFTKAGLPHRLFHVGDGNHAIMYLEGIAPFSDRHRFPFPHLVILDIQMPNGNGFEVLSILRERPLIQAPVVMFSSSSIARDVRLAAELGAIHFFTKPISVGEMMELARTVDARWLSNRGKKAQRSASAARIEGKSARSR
jgi:CheY-like chemotaxis protein